MRSPQKSSLHDEHVFAIRWLKLHSVGDLLEKKSSDIKVQFHRGTFRIQVVITKNMIWLVSSLWISNPADKRPFLFSITCMSHPSPVLGSVLNGISLQFYAWVPHGETYSWGPSPTMTTKNPETAESSTQFCLKVHYPLWLDKIKLHQGLYQNFCIRSTAARVRGQFLWLLLLLHVQIILAEVEIYCWRPRMFAFIEALKYSSIFLFFNFPKAVPSSWEI